MPTGSAKMGNVESFIVPICLLNLKFIADKLINIIILCLTV